MNLMIVESPNKVKKIKTFLGPGWDVAASVGHQQAGQAFRRVSCLQ
jgi:DNA topoisomerase IA